MVFYIKREQITSFLDRSAPLLVILAVLLLAYYQTSYLFPANQGAIFLEPDNYEYYLFVQMAFQQHNINVSNPYLVYPQVGFFEHAGLYQLPLFLHDATPSIPILWDFRIIQILVIAGIYGLTLLIARTILKHVTLSKYYAYYIYALILSSAFLMQYNEAIEWRGTSFIVLIQLAMLYIIAYFFTKEVKSRLEFIIYPLSLLGLLLLSFWLWSGGFLNVIALAGLILILGLYHYVIEPHPALWKYIALGMIAIAILLFLFYAPIESFVSGITGFENCTNNILNLGELNCVTPSNGLTLLIVDIVFGVFAMLMLLTPKNIYSGERKRYEYYVVGVIGLAMLQLPLVLVYLRMISVVAPYFTLLFAFGLVAMFTYFAKAGSNPVVRSLVMLGIYIGSLGGGYLFYSSSVYLQTQSSPLGLTDVALYLNSSAMANSTIFAYYGYGGYLEDFGHVKVYSDTIQELEYAFALSSYFNLSSSAFCHNMSMLKPVPDYVLLSTQMLNISIFANASNQSVLRFLPSFDCPAYAPIYNSDGFYLYRLTA